MKIFICVLILMVINIQLVIAELMCIGEGELIFYNYYRDGVTVKVIPFGSIFSGHTSFTTGNEYKYSSRTCYRSTNSGTNWTHVVGGNRTMSLLPTGIFPPHCGNNSGGYAVFDWDDGNNYKWDSYYHPEVCVGAVSYGLWKVEFWYIPSEESQPYLVNSCKIDYRDWRAPQGCYLNNDLFVKLTSDNNIYFFWGNSFDQESEGSWISITNQYVPDRTIQWFRQVRTEQGEIVQCSNGQNRGNFLTTNADGGYWLNFPIDANALNSNYAHSYPEFLNMNLSVASGHHAYIKPDKTMYIENGSKFTVSDNAILTFQPNSTLYVKHGGKFCNYGTVNGNINIIYERRGIYNYCSPSHSPFISGNITIEDSAIVEFPDSTTIVFDSSAVFTMNPHSELRLGQYTKLVFQNGSRIKCDNVKITSLDSTQTWDGIYLDGIAYDTLKNCTFQNAVNGINITDNYYPFGSPGAVEISNCTFKNSTSSDLLNYVYVNNSYNVLIKGCNSEKTGSGGFTSGIIAEYCPTNGVVIADNNINYVTTGISLLQSSEYIGRNTMTGSTNSGTGIYLDNSNGTIEYNTVNNFQKSVYGSYSSPYMLKNILSNAYIKNIDLASNSYPVMKPVVSGSTLRWLGGNNTISGTPSNSGIAFADCYPLMDSGYNRITVNGSDYMNGNFTFVYTTVNAKINYWYDNPPQSSLFDISGGNVNYSDPFDGSTLPSTDGTELNSSDWGLYDKYSQNHLAITPPQKTYSCRHTQKKCHKTTLMQ